MQNLPTRPLRITSVQMEHLAGDKAANLEKVRAFTRRAAAEGAQVALFPECCLTGYWFLRKLSRESLTALAEPVPDGPACQALKAMAAECRITVGAGLVEIASDGRLFNCFVVALPDGRCYRHRKIHTFVSGHMDSGDEYTLFDLHDGWRVGVLTCYDNNIIENVRMTALQGAHLLLAPHQTGGCASPDLNQMSLVDRKLWENRRQDPQAIEAELAGPKGRGWLMRWLPSRAHDNGLFLAFSNGVGFDDDEIRTGNAMILDPYGRVIVETGKADDDMVISDLDPALLERATGRRWMRTRRPELYGPLTRPTGQEVSTRESRMSAGKPKG